MIIISKNNYNREYVRKTTSKTILHVLPQCVLEKPLTTNAYNCLTDACVVFITLLQVEGMSKYIQHFYKLTICNKNA